MKVSRQESEIRSRLATTESQLREKEEFYEYHKNKNWEEAQRQISIYKTKSKQLEELKNSIENKYEEELEKLRMELEGVYQEKDQLESML